MTKTEFREIRRALGMNTTQLAECLGLGRHGYRTIERIEAGANITGPMRLAMLKLMDGADRGRP
jgi:DNA-binding XRE family transcriptional regulator